MGRQLPTTAFPSHHRPTGTTGADGHPRRILHVDFDAYFASVEELTNPLLAGRRVIVGGSPDGRGVVTSATYNCRQFGIHAGMPAGEAKRLCPDAIFVRGSLDHYTHLTGEVMATFARYSPFVQAISIDEAFLDVTGCADVFGDEDALCRTMKNDVRERFGLICSLGVGPNKLIAKMASAVFKPDGLTILQPDDIEHVLFSLPVDKIWGIGPASSKVLCEAGIKTIGELAGAAETRLSKLLGKNGPALQRVVRGGDDGAVKRTGETREEKSIGHERTFDADHADRDFLVATLHRLADLVGIRVRRGGWQAQTVAVKIRYADWETITRRITLQNPTDDSVRIFNVSRQVFHNNWARSRPIRLLGISVSQLKKNEEAAHQLSLFVRPSGEQADVDRTIDAIRERYGRHVIGRAYSVLGVR